MNADAQLSVTAPTRINYVLEADGTFTCPDATAVTVENHSAVPVAAKSWAADVKAGNAVEKADFGGATGANAWWNTAQPDSGEEYAFNLSQDELYDDWNMAADGQTLPSGQDDTVEVTTAGAMKNIDGSVDFNEAKQLSQVTWVFGTVMNGKGEPKPDPENGTAFAVYSADDNSLDFYKRNKLPKVGTEFNGKTATAVYTGIETDSYNAGYGLQQPWKTYRSAISSAAVVDEGISPISTSYWFQALSNMSNCDVEKLNTSNVTNMEGMFIGCSQLTSLDTSRFDTAQVASMGSLFCLCSSLTSLDVSSFDTSKVTNMTNMFHNCSSLTSLDISRFNTGEVTSISAMFYGCSKLTMLDLSSFNMTMYLTDMHNMFDKCYKLGTVKLSERFWWRDNDCYLPTPDSQYFTGADGLWYAESDGSGYAPEHIPSNKADTYYASKSLLPQT